MDAEDNALDPDDVKDAADPDGDQTKPKQTRKVIGDGFVHYAADVYAILRAPRHRAHRPHLPALRRRGVLPLQKLRRPVTTTW